MAGVALRDMYLYYYSVAFCSLFVYVALRWWTSATYKMQHIPTVGSSGIVSSYRDAFRFSRHAHEAVAEGYRKHYGNAFKVATMSRWLVVPSGAQMLEDIRRATDDQLSLGDVVVENLQTDYTIGVENRLDPYHIKVVRSPLTRNFGQRLADIQDEVSQAFEDLLYRSKEDGTDWVTVTASDAAREVVCRTSNRLFVGLPLCRDPDYRSLNERFTMEVVTQAYFINMFPSFMKPIVGRLASKFESNKRRAASHVGPMIQERLATLDGNDNKNQVNLPNDLISWLLEEAKESQKTINDLAVRILHVNFASIHTTSMGLTNILFDLATYPEYIEPMREEVSAIVKAEGWTKSSVAKMRKVDSFIKESQRLNSSSFSTMRKALKDFTFSNGVTVPAGTYIAIPALPIHLDERNYDNAKIFQGFRFIDIRDEEDEGTKHQTVSISSEFLTFGIGRHACPGRFLAASQLKATLAHIILSYDVRLANSDGLRPEPFWIIGQTAPNMTAKMMFKKRTS